MDQAMRLTYDAEGDILYLQSCPPNASQRVVEVAEGVLVRLNGESGDVEGYEVQGFTAREWNGAELILPPAVTGVASATA